MDESTHSLTAISSNTERLLGAVGVGMWKWDGTTGRFSMDGTCRRMLGLGPGDDPTFDELSELMYEEDVARYKAAIAECLSTGAFQVEYRIRLRGEIRFLSGRGHAMPTLPGQSPVVKGVIIDVTRTKELESRLRSSESQMEQLADGLPGWFSYIDENLHVRFMNSRYRETLGLEKDQIRGRHIAELIGPERFADRKGRYEQVLQGSTVCVETNRKMPDGRHRYLTIRHVPHYGENGRVRGIMTLAMDITARRCAEQALQTKSAELERSNHDLEQFAYVASHDLKAPLRAIEVLVEWLREDLVGHDEGDVQENLGLLKQRTRRLNRLLDDLLAYSRADRRTGDVSRTDTRALVADIATLLAPPEGFTIVADESLPTFDAHRVPLEQVMRNLVNNAIKHHPSASGKVRVYARDQGDEIMFAVEDDGAGIPEQYADKVFQMFQTLQPRDEREGSGMGLAIVKRIIDWNGGRIWFHPGPEQLGTVFKFIWKKTGAMHPAEDPAGDYGGKNDDKARQHTAG